jgi:hypothetical protein
MNLDRRTAVAALAGAGLLWGTSVPPDQARPRLVAAFGDPVGLAQAAG